jgi:hypothetical protein
VAGCQGCPRCRVAGDGLERPDTGSKRRRCRHRDEQPERAQPGPLESHDQHDRGRTDRHRGPVEGERAQECVDRPGEPVPLAAVVSGEARELAEHDVDRDRVHEAREHGVRHEAHQLPEAEHSEDEHHRPGQQPEGGERPCGVLRTMQLGNVRDEHRHRARGLHRHQHRTRGDRARHRAHEIAVQPGHRVEPCEQTHREPVGNAHEPKRHAGSHVLRHPASCGSVLLHRGHGVTCETPDGRSSRTVAFATRVGSIADVMVLPLSAGPRIPPGTNALRQRAFGPCGVPDRPGVPRTRHHPIRVRASRGRFPAGSPPVPAHLRAPPPAGRPGHSNPA